MLSICRNRQVNKEKKGEKAQRLREENKEGQNDDTNVLRPKVTVFAQNGDGECEGRVGNNGGHEWLL